MRTILFQMAALGVLWLGFCAGIFGLRANAARAEDAPHYLELGDCAMPCWQGLRPGGGTPMNVFWAVLQDVKAAGGEMYDGAPSSMNGETLSSFHLTIVPTDAITVADVIAVYGPPQYAYVYEPGQTVLQIVDYPAWELALYWQDGAVSATGTHFTQTPGEHLYPAMPVRTINMQSPVLIAEDELEGGRRWRGFGHRVYYLTDN